MDLLGEYQRLLADISRYKTGKTYNQVLVEKGYAQLYDGGKKMSWKIPSAPESPIFITPMNHEICPQISKKCNYEQFTPHNQLHKRPLMSSSDHQWSPLGSSINGNCAYTTQ